MDNQSKMDKPKRSDGDGLEVWHMMNDVVGYRYAQVWGKGYQLLKFMRILISYEYINKWKKYLSFPTSKLLELLSNKMFINSSTGCLLNIVVFLKINVHTHWHRGETERGQSLEYIMKSSKKHNIWWLLNTRL